MEDFFCTRMSIFVHCFVLCCCFNIEYPHTSKSGVWSNSIKMTLQMSETITVTNGKVSEKRDLACIIKKHNKNALRLKCYNFRRVNAIVFLFSALQTTPFLYGKIHFGILNMLHASIAMSDTPRGSNPP